MGYAANASAVTIGTWADYNMSKVKYKNRVLLSNNAADFDFRSEDSHDVNGDGIIDFLEAETFVSQGTSCEIFVGNESSRYALKNVLLWIGVSGSFDEFTVDGLKVCSSDALDTNEPESFFPHSELSSFVDQVVLLELEEGVGKRTSKYDPVSSCGPLSLVLSDFISSDSEVRVYMSVYGAIKSGFNSYAMSSSDILFMPEVCAAETQPVPEPATILLSVLGIAALVVRKK